MTTLAATEALCQKYRKALEEIGKWCRTSTHTVTEEIVSTTLATPSPTAVLNSAIADWVSSELRDYRYGTGAEDIEAFLLRRIKELREQGK